MSIADRLEWRSLDRAGLDRGFNNSQAVPGSAETLAGWETRSAEARLRHPQHLGLAYGPKERNRIDLILAGPGAPTLVYVHGGYWQMRSRETFTFFAEGPLARGMNVALVGYTLAPDATLDEMTAEVRAALDWLAAELPRLGGDPSKIWISGWSAGGHLAAAVLDHPSVRGGLAISGLYDLEPIRHCYVNDKLGLDAEAAARNSPLLHIKPTDKPLIVAVGGAELPLMRQQSIDYAEARRKAGLRGSFHELPGEDHFSLIEDFAKPDGRLTDLAADLCGADR